MKKNDVVLILTLLAVFAVGIIALKLFAVQGREVVVTVDGKPFGTYRLSDHAKYVPINGKNVLVIQNKEAYMEYADCPDQICVKHRHIKNRGEEIICMPNRVIVRITGGKNNE